MAIGDNNSNFDPQWDYINRCGFVDLTETSISFNDTTYVFTLTDSGNGWRYFRNGENYFVTGNKTATLPGSPPVADVYFIYINSTDGTLTASDSPWTLTNDNIIPVAVIMWNNALTPKYWLADERHTARIDRRMHWYEHFTSGTKLLDGGDLDDYTVTAGSPANDDANTFSVEEAHIADEDLYHTLTALADGDGTSTDYTIFYRTAIGAWAWEKSAVPFRYTALGYIQYDNAGTMTEGTANDFYNTYLLFTNLTGAARFALIHGRSQFTSAATAYAEQPNFDMTGFPIQEAVIMYQLTWATNNSYTTKGKCKLSRAPQRIAASLVSTVVGSSTTDHNTLGGLQGGTAAEYYHLTNAEYTNNALRTDKLSAFAATTSAELKGVISDETGTGGSLVFSTSPSLTTPSLGVASATTVNKVTITTPATGSTLTIADGKTLTVNNTLTFTGTDSSSAAFGAGGTVAYTSNKLSAFAATTSAELAGVLSDETGSGYVVYDTDPTFRTKITTPQTKYTTIPGTDHTVSGSIIALTAAVNVAIGDACYIDSAGKAALCKADAIANCPYCLVMCADATINQNASGNFITVGSVRDDTWNWATVGGLIYISTTGTTGNTLTQAAPSGANNVICPVGVALSSDVIYFTGNVNTVEHT